MIAFLVERAGLLTTRSGYSYVSQRTAATDRTGHLRNMNPTGSSATTQAVVVGLAVLPAVVHFRCFLHRSLAPAARNVLFLLQISSLIVIRMVLGKLVILINLRMRIM